MTLPNTKFSPTAVVIDVAALLHTAGIPIDLDEPMTKKAWLLAAMLIRELGAEPEIDADDHTREAEQVREMLLESRVPTTTRSRRSV